MSETLPVQLLVAYLKTHDIKFSVLPESGRYREIFWREILVSINNTSFIVPVFDEFCDVELDNAAVWFHLVLETCECFEEAKDYKEWLIDFNGLTDNALSQSLFDDLKILVPKLRSQLGKTPLAIDSSEIEFNTNIAKDLRACKNPL